MKDLENTTDFRSRSLLDTDLYKLMMQQAILQHFPKTNATYKFTNRSTEKRFSRECFELVKHSISRLAELRLTTKEAEWLKTNCPYFTQDYLHYLCSYRFRPDEQVKIELQVTSEPGADAEEGHIIMKISGLWVEVVLYEVPVMSILSEAYFLTVDRCWTYEGQEEFAYQKAKRLIEAGISFSELGTRRRRSYRGQDIVLQGLTQGNNELSGQGMRGQLVSTSNPHFAMKYGLSVMGTITHEWVMAVNKQYVSETHTNLGALFRLRQSVATKMETVWQWIYGKQHSRPRSQTLFILFPPIPSRPTCLI